MSYGFAAQAPNQKSKHLRKKNIYLIMRSKIRICTMNATAEIDAIFALCT